VEIWMCFFLNITFPSLPCILLSVNAIDKAGNHQLDVHHDVYTTRLNSNGTPVQIHDAKLKEVVGEEKDRPKDIDLKPNNNCGNCYGAETPLKPCCETCNDVKEAYHKMGWIFRDPNLIAQCVKEGFKENIESQKEEGCNVQGKITVKRVTGNINIVIGNFIIQNARYIVDSNIFKGLKTKDGAYIFNTSHILHSLSFGQEFPGMRNPLNGIKKNWEDTKFSAMYEYFVKIVPTRYKISKNSPSIVTNQYSVTEYIAKIDIGAPYNRGVPGLIIVYEFSSITVDFEESGVSFLHFFTNLLAVLGGVFTVTSLIDSIFHKVSKKIQRKNLQLLS